MEHDKNNGCTCTYGRHCDGTQVNTKMNTRQMEYEKCGHNDHGRH